MSECILWTGALNSAGYGVRRMGGKPGLVHRQEWEKVHGPILGDLTIDHVAGLCSARHCMNVEHMELVTRSENSRRGNALRGPQVKCEHGDQERNQWGCLICRRQSSREFRARQREKRAAS